MNFLENMDRIQKEHIGRLGAEIAELLSDFHQMRMVTGKHSAAERAELVNTNAKSTEALLKDFNQSRINGNQTRIKTASQDKQQRLTFASNMTRKVVDLLDQFHASRQQMAETSAAERADLVSTNAKAIEEMLKVFNQTRINVNQIRIDMASQDIRRRLTFVSNITREVGSEQEVITPKIKARLLKGNVATIASESTIDDQVKEPVVKNKQSEAKTTLNSKTRKTKKSRKSSANVSQKFLNK